MRFTYVRQTVAIALTAVLLGAVSAQAQAPPADEPGFSGEAELSLVAATGNSEAQTLGMGGQIAHHPDDWEELFRGNFVRTADSTGLKAKSLTMTARVSHRISVRSDWLVEFDYLSNRFAGIAARSNLNAGFTYRLLPAPRRHTLRLLIGFGYLNEKPDDSSFESSATSSVGLRYRWQLTNRGELSAESQLTDNLSRKSEWRVSQNFSLSSSLASAFSLKVSERTEYVRVPVPGFKSTDTLTSAAIVVKF